MHGRRSSSFSGLLSLSPCWLLLQWLVFGLLPRLFLGFRSSFYPQDSSQRTPDADGQEEKAQGEEGGDQHEEGCGRGPGVLRALLSAPDRGFSDKVEKTQ